MKTALLVSLLVGALTALTASALPRDQHHHQERVQEIDSQRASSSAAGAGQVGVAEQVVGRLKREATTNSTTARRRPPGTHKKSTGDLKKKLAGCLAEHNKYRRLHGVPELKWDNKIAAFSQKRSDHIAASDGKEFSHPDDLPYGENLFWHSSSKTSCEYMVKGWYDEIKLYDYAKAAFSHAAGHFTQVVWRETSRVGCAFAESSGPRGGLFLTCNYDPPGNVYGLFQEDVPRPGGGPRNGPTTMVTPVTNATSATRPDTTLAPTTTATSDVTSTTTKPKSKKKNRRKKNKNKKKKTDERNKMDENPKRKKRRGKKKKTTSTTTSAPESTTTTTRPISS